MTLHESLEFLNEALTLPNKKNKQKSIECSIKTMQALIDHGFSTEEMQSIENRLEKLNFLHQHSDKSSDLSSHHTKFKLFLKRKFGLTTPRFYREMGIIYGMIFGNALGISIGLAIDPVLGVSFGISFGTGIGMMIGFLIGKQKDAKALQEGNVL